jgi:hypothetical protein
MFRTELISLFLMEFFHIIIGLLLLYRYGVGGIGGGRMKIALFLVGIKWNDDVKVI